MKSTCLIIFISLMVSSQASIFSSFTKSTTTTTTTTPGATNGESTTTTTTAAGAPTTETSGGNLVSTVMDQVFSKLNGVTDILEKAAQATAMTGQTASLGKLTEMKNQMNEIGGAIQSFDFKNVSNVASGLEDVGKKLLGVSGNATEVKQQLLNAAIKGITDGTFCKSPAELAASLGQNVLGNIVGNIPGLSGIAGGVGGDTTNGASGSLASAGALVGTLAKTAEGAGTLSTGLGVALGAAKCLGTVGALAGTVGTGGALAPILMMLG